MENIPMLLTYLYPHQKQAIDEQNKHKKCVINMWCGTGKTRTFTVYLFINSEKTNVIVFPSLGLINQYCNDYALSTEEPFKTQFEKYNCLAFCSDDDGKLKSKGKIQFTTDERRLNTFFKKKNNQIILVTYQSFEKFINICIDKNIHINNLIFDEAHHIVGGKIQDIVFNNDDLDEIVDKTRFYTATPVNKNGITMYDREDQENSDCGELAYEYLYHQAVEDGICKPFETQISLYRQIPEYTNKYQPVFESIIRACLSGKYDYWNILTYHSFVNENEDMNANISFVNDFASPKNQKLVKKLFTRIQNEEFPHTKHTYSVDNVILKGVHSETPTRQQIIQDFDKKVPGRIYILASCGILNEGIDTKWANMGVPINPTQSIVKESQRIGRLVRIPEQGMPPAIILIPCEVDVTKYSSMDTAEQRDQMIREELSECGNFNTALNVISAFKYQYDPDLFEMCLKYPNMYAPQEVKDNLAKQGLIVEDSRGDLLDNLKYVCEKERIDLDTESFEGENEINILKEVAELSEKTIEIHTQNYNEPVKYINEEATDEEPLRLFYCEDDKTYSPILKKDKKQKIKRKSTTPPKKRPKLFDVHTHPDLEVLWKIKESSIDLNKTFSQGVLDVDINWNEKRWEDNLEKVKEFMDKNGRRPSSNTGTNKEKIIGRWVDGQRCLYRKNKYMMKYENIRKKWSDFVNNPKYKEYFLNDKEKWYKMYNNLIKFINTYKKTPSTISSNNEEKILGIWLSNQKQDYNKNIDIMKDEEIKNKWYELIINPLYKEYFKSKEEKWFDALLEIKKFIIENMRRPSSNTGTNKEKYLGHKFDINRNNYEKKRSLMKKKKIYDTWNEFINNPKYKSYLKNREEIWIDILDKVKEFINKYNRKPNRNRNDDEGILGRWIDNQISNYKLKLCSMKEKKIYNLWFEFINDSKYKHYFVNNNQLWFKELKNTKLFIDKNDKRPSSKSKDTEEKHLGMWIGSQIKKCKKKSGIFKEKEIYDEWIKFINDPKYKEYLLTKEEEWLNNLENVKDFMDTYNKKPDRDSEEDGRLGRWIDTQTTQFKKDNYKYKKEWYEFINNFKYNKYFKSLKEIWFENLKNIKLFIHANNKRPIQQSKCEIEKKHSNWMRNQKNNSKKKNYEYKKEWIEFISDPKYSKYFDSAKPKKDMSKPEIKPKTDKEIKEERQKRSQSELSQLHKEYKTKNSQNLNTFFKENPEKWKEYHKISKDNEESFQEEEIPRNKMIKYLEELPGKKKKVVADLGCGFAEINQHFQDNSRFEFHNFDHISDNDMVVSRDIKNTELEDYSVDIAILSLAMWGSNCKEYLQEAYRILDTGGTVLIAEAFKRWNKELDDEGNPINRLVNLLEENNFTIIEKIENKFMFIECRKN